MLAKKYIHVVTDVFNVFLIPINEILQKQVHDKKKKKRISIGVKNYGTLKVCNILQ